MFEEQLDAIGQAVVFRSGHTWAQMLILLGGYVKSAHLLSLSFLIGWRVDVRIE